MKPRVLSLFACGSAGWAGAWVTHWLLETGGWRNHSILLSSLLVILIFSLGFLSIQLMIDLFQPDVRNRDRRHTQTTT